MKHYLRNFFGSVVFSLGFLASVFSQSMGVNTTGATPNSKALFDINADNVSGEKKGLLIPRMTTTERNTLSSTGTIPESLLIYNTTTQCFEAWNQTSLGWVAFGCLNCQLPGAFVVSAASSIVSTSFDANWSASVGATGYFLDVSTSSTFASFVTGFDNLSVSNVLTYSLTGLTAGTTYYYRVRAVNACGTSTNSNTITQATCTLPGAFTASAASSVASTSFSANWSASAGATGYYLDVSTSNTFASFVTGFDNLSVSNVLTYSLTGLTAGTTYYYRVRAVNACGTSTNSNTITQATCTLPGAFTASAASSVDFTSFSANWSASVGATGYFLDVSTSSTFASFVTGFDNLSVSNVLTYSVTGLTAGTTYYYRVRAVNACGTSTNSNTITQATCALPGAFTASAASSVASTSFSANWSASAGATGYYLDVSTSSTFASFVTGFNNLSVSNVVTYSVTGLAASTTYYYRVRAINACGTTANSNTIAQATSAPPLSAGCNTAQVEADYGTVVTSLSGASQTWITRNLGATAIASSATSTTNAEQGCYFQFNRAQAYGFDNPGPVNPSWTITSISESSDWLIGNDPCRIQLGGSWRIPTSTEWNNADATGAWNSRSDTYASELKLHAAGFLNAGAVGALMDIGNGGYYRSSTQASATNSWYLLLNGGMSTMLSDSKAHGFSVRCLK